MRFSTHAHSHAGVQVTDLAIADTAPEVYKWDSIDDSHGADVTHMLVTSKPKKSQLPYDVVHMPKGIAERLRAQGCLRIEYHCSVTHVPDGRCTT